MAVYKRRIRELALKVETAPGTFNAPATDGTESKILLLNNPTATWDFEAHDRDIQTTDLSQFPAIIGKTRMRLTFDVEMRRSESSITPDQWMLILRAGGLKLTAPASNCVYTTSSEYSTDTHLSAYAYLGSSGAATQRVALKGIQANLSGDHVVGQASILHVELFGVYNGFSSAGAVNSVTHETAVPSAFLGKTFTFGAFAAKISRFGWALNNVVVEREDVSAAEGVICYVITGRNPTFTMDPEAEPTGTFDFNGRFLAGTTSAVAFNIHSTTLSLAAPAAQITALDDLDRNGLVCFGLSGKLCRSSGDDELVITAA
jgi:hypothetical protein